MCRAAFLGAAVEVACNNPAPGARGMPHVRAPMVCRLDTALAMTAAAGGSTALPRKAAMPPAASPFSMSLTWGPPPHHAHLTPEGPRPSPPPTRRGDTRLIAKLTSGGPSDLAQQACRGMGRGGDTPAGTARPAKCGATPAAGRARGRWSERGCTGGTPRPAGTAQRGRAAASRWPLRSRSPARPRQLAHMTCVHPRATVAHHHSAVSLLR